MDSEKLKNSLKAKKIIRNLVFDWTIFVPISFFSKFSNDFETIFFEKKKQGCSVSYLENSRVHDSNS